MHTYPRYDFRYQISQEPIDVDECIVALIREHPEELIRSWQYLTKERTSVDPLHLYIFQQAIEQSVAEGRYRVCYNYMYINYKEFIQPVIEGIKTRWTRLNFIYEGTKLHIDPIYPYTTMRLDIFTEEDKLRLLNNLHMDDAVVSTLANELIDLYRHFMYKLYGNKKEESNCNLVNE